jgi:polyketide biosynthesis enoyl-CoA hydratase PksH
MVAVNYETIKVHFQESICLVQFDRPRANNTINSQLVEECHDVLSACEERATVVVFGGSPEVFCFGADFGAFSTAEIRNEEGPGSLYDLWLRFTTGPFITISHVRGKANAGGIGFIAASDVVIAEDTAQFSLSELLFGLYPACVLPFLIRRIGFQKANYLTLMTWPISAPLALTYGLVDAFDTESDALLRRHLLRLRRLSKPAITRYKLYMNKINHSLTQSKPVAIAGNLEIFSDPTNLEAISRYMRDGLLPWEKSQ